MLKSIALVTTENLPPSSRPCAGGGVRVWGLGEALRHHGIEVTYVLPDDWLESLDPRIPVPAIGFQPHTLFDTLNSLQVDSVLVEQWQPLTFLPDKINKPLIIDLPGPLVMEYYWRDPESYLGHITDKALSLGKADSFTCALESQRGYYTAWLNWAGFPPDENRLCVTPFVMHDMPQANQRHTVDEPALFWGGMFWPWHDRFDAFETVVETLQSAQRGQLVVSGWDGIPPCPDPRYENYTNHPHITWLGNLNFTDYITEIKQSHAALDIARPTRERFISSDLRTGTALWAGTPCIVSQQSHWSTEISKFNAGWIIPYQDRKQLASVVRSIARETGDRTIRWRGAKAVSETLCRPERVQALIELASQTKRAEKPTPQWDERTRQREEQIRELQQQLDTLHHQTDTLEYELGRIRANPLFRLYKGITSLWKR